MNWLTSAFVRERLPLVDSELQSVAAEAGPFAEPICSHLFRAGGKRLRPALVLLAAEYGNPRLAPRAVLAGAVIEMAHIASLYHDDVLDRALTRRGLPSVNAAWGNKAAVAAGCFLVSVVARRGAVLGDAINRAVGQTVHTIWSGQMLQIAEAGRLDVREERLLDIAEMKTASLFSLSARVGALAAETPPAILDLLARYARLLGIAFQLTDDALDLAGDAGTLGKPPGNDLRQGVYTLPVVDTLRGRAPGGPELRAMLEAGDFDGCTRLLNSNGSIRLTVNRAREFAGRAIHELRDLPPPGAARSSLIALAGFVAGRLEQFE